VEREWFRFYPAAWQTSPHVIVMTATGRAGYLSLLCSAWVAKDSGYLPGDDTALQRLSGLTEAEWEANRGAILANFERRGDKVYNSKLLTQVRQLQRSREAPTDVAAPVPEELRDLPLYAADKALCRRWPELYESLKAACPGVDVLAEIAQAHSWEVANPKKRKKNRTRFLQSWLNRAQDRRSRPTPGKLAPFAPTEDDLGAWARKATGRGNE
jgi:uncharacterized protein YdaU (DUF1376 family)